MVIGMDKLMRIGACGPASGKAQTWQRAKDEDLAEAGPASTTDQIASPPLGALVRQAAPRHGCHRTPPARPP